VSSPHPFDSGSRSRLGLRDLPRFPSDSLFDRIARVVCAAGCLPRKELYESWEVARRTRRRFRGGRVLDLACGHGLLAHLMLLLDDSSSDALAVDTRLPPSALVLQQALVDAWPRLKGRIELRAARLEEVAARAGDLLVSAHACGALTDQVLAAAVAARARVAVLPCCHDEATCDAGGLRGWLDVPTAVDATRVAVLRAAKYAVYTQTIPVEITPKNRLLLGEPAQ
jgi:hypothetical protein